MSPSWNEVRIDLEIVQAVTRMALAKHASLPGLPPELREDRELAIGKHLHDAHSAAEQVLERLVLQLDGTPPDSRRFHQDLLNRAQAPVPGLRPAIISAETGRSLLRLLRFRHAYRHVYEGFDYELAAPNLPVLEATMPRFVEEVTAFARATGLLPGA